MLTHTHQEESDDMTYSSMLGQASSSPRWGLEQ